MPYQMIQITINLTAYNIQFMFDKGLSANLTWQSIQRKMIKQVNVF